MGRGSGEGKLLAGLVIILIIVLWFPQASSRRRDSLEFRHGRDGRVLLEVHDDCHRLAQPRRVVLGPSYGESFPRCLNELLQGFIVKRARATTCGDKPAPRHGTVFFWWRTVEIPTTHCRYRVPIAHCRSRIPTTHCRYRIPTTHFRYRSPTTHFR